MNNGAWATPTSTHKPGVYNKSALEGGYGQTLTTVDSRKYEVYGFSKTNSVNCIWAGSTISATSDANCLMSSVGTSSETTNEWISCVIYGLGSSYSNLSASGTEFNGMGTSGSYQFNFRVEKKLTIKVNGYDQFSIWAKDNNTSTKHFVVTVDGVEQSMTLSNSSSGTVRRFALTMGEHTIVVSTVNTSGSSDSNSVLWGFSLRLPATITTTIGATGWSTFSNANALDFAHATPSNPASADLKAYMITGAAGTSITKSAALDDAPGSTGLLINGTAGETYTIPVLASSSTSTTGNLMKPCVTATTVNYDDNAGFNYVLMNNSGTPEFQKIVNGTYSSANVGAGKAYLALTSDPGSRALSLFDDETTGVASVGKAKTTTNCEFYNLAGQRVAQPLKGLYIVNGRKIVIR